MRLTNPQKWESESRWNEGETWMEFISEKRNYNWKGHLDTTRSALSAYIAKDVGRAGPRRADRCGMPGGRALAIVFNRAQNLKSES
jgi:hypothetical protein